MKSRHTKSRSTTRVSILFLAALAAVPVAPAHAGVSGSAALTSDYVFRGVSQTNGDPAVQAGVFGRKASQPQPDRDPIAQHIVIFDYQDPHPISSRRSHGR